jgi:hypothetical protein
MPYAATSCLAADLNIQPFVAQCFQLVLLPFVTMTREQWLLFLLMVAEQRICVSCWAPQLEPYLSRQGFALEFSHCLPPLTLLHAAALREDYDRLCLVSADCQCEIDDAPETP